MRSLERSLPRRTGPYRAPTPATFSSRLQWTLYLPGVLRLARPNQLREMRNAYDKRERDRGTLHVTSVDEHDALVLAQTGGFGASEAVHEGGQGSAGGLVRGSDVALDQELEAQLGRF